MKKKINIALIGCGRVAEHYKYVFNKIKNKNYVIIAVVDTNSKKAELLEDIINVSIIQISKK